MIRIDRICTLLFIIVFALIIPTVKWVTLVDEAATAALAGCALADCIVNRNWRRYKLLWLFMGVMTFYALYSLTFVHYNTPAAILKDWIIQLKPFIPLAVFLAIGPTFTAGEKFALKVLAVANFVVAVAIFALGNAGIVAIIHHISHIGITIFLSAIIYYYCSVEPDGSVGQRNVLIVVGFLLVGLICGRAKYYGSLVFTLFMLLVYRPGMLHASAKRAIAICAAVVLLVAIVGWQKFSYYFITGTSDHFDPEVMSSYARPVMYATGGLILLSLIPFGSGLASFASFASVEPYSGVYREYGISGIYGLSPTMPDFICDAFYPSLAQFGIVGIVLFIAFWRYIAILLRDTIRSGRPEATTLYRCAWSVIVFILIESIASTTFVHCSGMVCSMLLGIICSPAYISRTEKSRTEKSESPIYYGT